MSLRSIAKKLIDYTIEDEYKVYRLKHTPFVCRRMFTGEFHKVCQSTEICPNKIVFDNYMGNGYGCNCKYVLEKLLAMYPEFMNNADVVWVVKNAKQCQDSFPNGVRLVEYGSREAFFEYATAHIWINNFQMVHYLNKGLLKRKGQIYIQMWHGSLGIKKIEGNCDYLKRDKAWLALAKRNADYTDYWISNSSFETQVYKDAFWGAGSILEYGHPRNDIFFVKDSSVSEHIKEKYFISDKKVLLYVPTFRDQGKSQSARLDVDSLLDACRKRFGGRWVFALRNHPRHTEDVRSLITSQNAEDVIDVTEYPDIQELLTASDAVITDYSSAIFDFMLSGKPGFILAQDYETYENIRGLYYPLEETPFPLARTQQQLCDNIVGFDEDLYCEKCHDFLQQKGCVEDGKASDRVAALLINILKNEE